MSYSSFVWSFLVLKRLYFQGPHLDVRKLFKKCVIVWSDLIKLDVCFTGQDNHAIRIISLLNGKLNEIKGNNVSIHFHLKKLNIMKTSFTHTFILFFFCVCMCLYWGLLMQIFSSSLIGWLDQSDRVGGRITRDRTDVGRAMTKTCYKWHCWLFVYCFRLKRYNG